MTDNTVNRSSSKSAIAIALLAGLLALLVRWYFVTHAQVMQPLYREAGWGDAAEYYRYAWHLVHHGLFSSDAIGVANPKSDSFRDPVYPVFLALGMIVTEDYDRWYALILLTQAAMGGITVACAAWTLRDVLPTWLVAVAATTMALWPHLVVIPAYVLSENLGALFFAITVLALGEAARKRSLAYTMVGGVALALAALTNSVLAPLFIPLALVLAWKRMMPRRHLLVFAAVVAVPALAWGIRNASIQGPYSPLFRAEINLVQGSWPTYHVASHLWAKHDPAGIQTIDAINLEIATLHIDHALGLEHMAQRMSHTPGTYLAWYLGKPALLWGWEIGLGAGDIYPYPTRNSPFITNPAMKAVEAVTFVCNGVLALLALAGVIVVALHRRPSAAVLTIAVTAVWVTLVYGVLQSDPRYSIPFRTGEIALACVAAAAAVNWVRHRRAAAR
jgi:4-amino-4-deoxy-L-arabinose transferase-like glycosyltransferase